METSFPKCDRIHHPLDKIRSEQHSGRLPYLTATNGKVTDPTAFRAFTRRCWSIAAALALRMFGASPSSCLERPPFYEDNCVRHGFYKVSKQEGRRRAEDDSLIIIAMSYFIGQQQWTRGKKSLFLSGKMTIY